MLPFQPGLPSTPCKKKKRTHTQSTKFWKDDRPGEIKRVPSSLSEKKKQKWIGCSRWFLYYGGAWRCVHACNARYCSEIAPACICTIVRSHHHAKLPQMAPLLITGNYNRWVSLAVAHTLTFLIYELWSPGRPLKLSLVAPHSPTYVSQTVGICPPVPYPPRIQGFQAN
jgi:hypothetical protein